MKLPEREPARRRLERERPVPERRFTERSRRALSERWTAMARPAGLWPWSLGLGVVGLALMVIALVIALR